jgi:supervillin
MMIHTGKREDESTNTSGNWRLYVVRGELPDECYLMEVQCLMSSLRSRASMILINVKTGIMQVWHGSKSASHTRQQALTIGKALEKR